MSQYFLYAPNIHQGGGKVLLLPLLELLRGCEEVTFILDERLLLPEGLVLAGTVFRVNSNVYSRLAMEVKLCSLLQSDSSLLCMGNLPPLLAKSARCRLFLQNRYLVEYIPLTGFSMLAKFRLTLERWWLKYRINTVENIMVQTPTMQRLAQARLGQKVDISPFVGEISALGNLSGVKQYDYLYVASGEPHKNHEVLIKAWVKLADANIYPCLGLTLSQQASPELFRWVLLMIKQHKLNVVLIKPCSHSSIFQLLGETSAVIYPSVFESFGLPLVEAALMGLPIAASNLDYVTDVVQPTILFDPSSPDSIAESIRGFNFKPAKLNIDLLTAKEFLFKVYGESFARQSQLWEEQLVR